MNKSDNLFVVKVQISIESSDNIQRVLVYDKSREYMVELEFPSKEAIALIGLDPNVLKSFYVARLKDDPKKPGAKHIELIERVKDEAW